MIPFVSQRGGGQDLATHLMNTHDNEDIELFQVRGAAARDLHGAFAEWEAIARALTRARQYLCSLSVNPDERQGRLTRDQYLDYIERAEERLGLTGQPRIIVFHRKRGADGREREHCHVVWSRTDADRERAVPLSFSKEKLMMVTREFARDHGLNLPPGYDRQADEPRRNRQLTGYDGIKQKETGISHEERMAAITDAWRRSDTGRALVNALADLGYILARGRNKTRVVLVDFYGHTTALTRLIDDPAVRAKHVRDFLGAEFAPERLPSVEEAQALAAQRRKAIEAFEEARATESVELAALARQQAARRQEMEAKAAALRWRQHEDRTQLAAVHKAARRKLKSSYLAAQRRIRLDRARRRPRGLAAFLGRVSGITLIIRAIQRRRDRTRYAAYLSVRNAIKRRQQQERDALADRHGLQAADIQRRLRALDQIAKRERQTLETAALNARRQAINARHLHMPSLAPAIMDLDGMSARESDGPHTGATLAQELARVAGQPKSQGNVRLTDTFGQVAGGGEEDSGEAGGTEAPAPAAEEKIRRRRRRRRRRDLDREFNSASGAEDGRSGNGDSDAGPRRRPRGQGPPDSGGPPRPRRNRKRDLDRGR